MEVVYDTGSDWLTIEGDYCTVCTGNKFNHNNSNTFRFLEDEQSTELNYGSANLEGLRASDKVCLGNDQSDNGLCLRDFEFFLISK